MSAQFQSSHSLLVSQIRTFLEAYRNERKTNKKKPPPASSALSSFSSFFDSSFADPTTFNALNTSTVVLRKKKDNSLKNSPFDGVRLSNYRFKPQDVPREVFDWVSHFLWLKNCPLELATIIATHVASRMSAETTRNDGDTSSNSFGQSQSELNPALASPESLGLHLNLSTMDQNTSDFSSRLSLPSALCSVDVARKSREMVDEYIEELGANPEQTVDMVQDYISSPTIASDPSTPTGPKGFTSSLCAIKNGRKTMEDRHIVIHDLNKTLNFQSPKQYSYYAIFDGHAGVDAASYSTAHLHHNLVSSPAFAEGRIEDAFREAFEITDSLYVKRIKEDGVDQLKASGTTALCALIEDNKTVYLAWLGDSQAVLVRNGCHEEIMLPHKPDLDSERTRIQDLGGLVVFVDTWRVNGVLSVTRAIGDPDHKPYINAEPSLAKFEIDSSLDFLVLGCDGLFDQLTSQDIASHVFEFLCKNETRDPQEVIYDVSAYLSQMAIKEGSSDNITSIVLFFKPFEQLVATGFPAEGETEFMQESANVVESTLASALPATNGGHFPYTDFSELPVGTNFNLHSMPEVPDPFEFNTKPAAMSNPFEDNVASNGEALFETNDFTTTGSHTGEPASAESVPVADWSQFEEPVQQEVAPTFQSEPEQSEHSLFEASAPSHLLQSSTTECFTSESETESQQVNDSIANNNTEPRSNANPFAMDEVNNAAAGQLLEAEDPQVKALTQPLQNTDLLLSDAPVINPIKDSFESPFGPSESVAVNPFAVESAIVEQSNISLGEDSNDEPSNLANVTLSSSMLENTTLSANVEAEQSAVLGAPQSVAVEHDINQNDDSIPEIVQHPSDSGYCYTNSINEFSTSFPSGNMIQDNFCSTPNQDEAAHDNTESESALSANQSIIQNTLDHSQVLAANNAGEPNPLVEPTINSWENSLQNNSLLIKTSQPKEPEVSSDIVQQEQQQVSQFESESIIEQTAPEPDSTSSIVFDDNKPQQQTAAALVDDLLVEQQTSNVQQAGQTGDVIQQQPDLMDVNFDEPMESVLAFSSTTSAPVKIEAEPTVQDVVEPLSADPVSELVTESIVAPITDAQPVVEPALDVTEIAETASLQAETIPEPLVVAESIETETVAIHDESSQIESIGDIAAADSKIESKPEEKASKLLPSKPKVPSALGAKKPLASTATGLAKAKPATTARVAGTLAKPSATKVGPTTTTSKATTKPITSTTTARSAATRIASSKPAPTKITSTLPKPASTLSSRPSVSPRVGSTTASRLATTQKPATTTPATRIGIASRTATTATARPIAPRVPISRVATKSTSQLISDKPVEQKPAGTIKRTVPSSTTSTSRLLGASTTRTATSATTRPSLTKSAAPSTTGSRTSRSPATTSTVSKIGSLRPTATKPSPKSGSSVPAAKPITPKPVNGVSATNGTKAVKKPAVVPAKVGSTTKTPESRVQPNGAVKSYSAKRSIGVENSLKQELEDAVMNGLNGGGSLPVPTTEEATTTNGVNGHNDQ